MSVGAQARGGAWGPQIRDTMSTARHMDATLSRSLSVRWAMAARCVRAVAKSDVQAFAACRMSVCSYCERRIQVRIERSWCIVREPLKALLASISSRKGLHVCILCMCACVPACVMDACVHVCVHEDVKLHRCQCPSLELRFRLGLPFAARARARRGHGRRDGRWRDTPPRRSRAMIAAGTPHRTRLAAVASAPHWGGAAPRVALRASGVGCSAYGSLPAAVLLCRRSRSFVVAPSSGVRPPRAGRRGFEGSKAGGTCRRGLPPIDCPRQRRSVPAGPRFHHEPSFSSQASPQPDLGEFNPCLANTRRNKRRPSRGGLRRARVAHVEPLPSVPRRQPIGTQIRCPERPAPIGSLPERTKPDAFAEGLVGALS